MSFRSTCPTCDLVSAFPEHRANTPHHCQRCGEFRFLQADGAPSSAAYPGASRPLPPVLALSDSAAMVRAFAAVGALFLLAMPVALRLYCWGDHRPVPSWLGLAQVGAACLAGLVTPLVLAVAGQMGRRGFWLLGALVGGTGGGGFLAFLLLLGAAGGARLPPAQVEVLGQFLGSLAAYVALPLLALMMGCLLAAAASTGSPWAGTSASRPQPRPVRSPGLGPPPLPPAHQNL